MPKSMEPNRKAHPECVHASNPYHECAYACLERIADGKGRKEVKKQASKLSNGGSFGNKKKEIESRPKPPQNGSLSTNKNSAKDPTTTPSKDSAQEKKNSSSFSSTSFEELSRNLYDQDYPFKPRQDQISGSVLVSLDNTPDHYKHATLKPPGHEITEEISGTVEGARGFDFIRPTISHKNSGRNNSEDDDDNDEDEINSVVSDSCVPVGRYHVRSSVSSTLQSIIDKHGDIAANCMLESASIRARYLECLCSVVEELKSTPFDRITKVRVKEMLAVLKDLETVNIAVDWLRNVLDGLLTAIEVKKRDREEVERQKGLVASLAAKLETLEDDLVQKEKETEEARERLVKTQARLRELEMELTRVNKVQEKVDKFRENSFMDGVI